MCVVHIKVLYRVPPWAQTLARSHPVRGLTLLLFVTPILHGVLLSDELQELILLDFEIFGEQFGAQSAGHGFPEGVAFLLEELEGAAMVLLEGARPGPVGLFDCLFERL